MKLCNKGKGVLLREGVSRVGVLLIVWGGGGRGRYEESVCVTFFNLMHSQHVVKRVSHEF